ncbi:MAG: hypothetical protein D6736_09590 [Nitrospinota bacterium]|nr:MAG: hypothetical protein D6736_09590 [Nitrospinota bacterium]
MDKLITIGTMNLGTPAANLNEDELLLLVGTTTLLDLVGVDFDPFSGAIQSMKVGSGELQFLNETHLANLPRDVEYISLVTQMPSGFGIGVCTALLAGSILIPPQLEVIFAAKGILVSTIAASLYSKICTSDGQSLPNPHMIGAVQQPSFYPNSDEIVGLDSQNLNNVFRAANGEDLVQKCINESPGENPSLIATVRCIPDTLHHQQSSAVDALLEALDIEPPIKIPGASQEVEVSTDTPARAPIADPAGLALDDAGNIYVSDRAAGTVTVIDPFGFSTTFISGLTEPTDIEISGSFLLVSDKVDVRAFPLGISGTITDFDGTPASLALITVRGEGGATSRTFAADASGGFNIPLTMIESKLKEEGLTLFLTIQTQGTQSKASRTVEVSVPVAVGSVTKERKQTIVNIQLPPG